MDNDFLDLDSPQNGDQPEVIISPELTPIRINQVNDSISALSQCININNEDIYHEPTCPVCSSAKRQEIEQLYTQNINSDYTTIIKSQLGVSYSKDIIENHVTQHKDVGAREIQKKEYANRIKRIQETSASSTFEKLSLAMAMVLDETMRLQSLVPTGVESAAEIEKLRSGEVAKLMGTFNNLIKTQATLAGEIISDGKALVFPRDAFAQLFQELLSDSSRTDRDRAIIKTILQKLNEISRKMQG